MDLAAARQPEDPASERLFRPQSRRGSALCSASGAMATSRSRIEIRTPAEPVGRTLRRLGRGRDRALRDSLAAWRSTTISSPSGSPRDKITQGSEFKIAYRLNWGNEWPPQPPEQQGDGAISPAAGSIPIRTVRLFVIDFTGRRRSPAKSCLTFRHRTARSPILSCSRTHRSAASDCLSNSIRKARNLSSFGAFSSVAPSRSARHGCTGGRSRKLQGLGAAHPAGSPVARCPRSASIAGRPGRALAGGRRHTRHRGLPVSSCFGLTAGDHRGSAPTKCTR